MSINVKTRRFLPRICCTAKVNNRVVSKAMHAFSAIFCFIIGFTTPARRYSSSILSVFAIPQNLDQHLAQKQSQIARPPLPHLFPFLSPAPPPLLPPFQRLTGGLLLPLPLPWHEGWSLLVVKRLLPFALLVLVSVRRPLLVLRLESQPQVPSRAQAAAA